MIKPKHIFIIITILIILALITAFSLGFFGSKDNSTGADDSVVQDYWGQFYRKGDGFINRNNVEVEQARPALLPVIFGLIQHVAEQAQNVRIDTTRLANTRMTDTARLAGTGGVYFGGTRVMPHTGTSAVNERMYGGLSAQLLPPKT